MFHNRKENSKINRIHERALRVLYNNDTSTFTELLEMDGSFTVHQRNIQFLAIEMYKSLNNIGPTLLKDIFVEREYNGPNLRSISEFSIPAVNSQYFGKDSLRYFGYSIWKLIPTDIKNTSNLDKFQSLIKNWKPNPCPCRLCKPFIYGLGHIGQIG